MYLGVIVDDKLNVAEHVEYVINKITKSYNLFRALRVYGNKYGFELKNRKAL